jgi:hypothetical protein
MRPRSSCLSSCSLARIRLRIVVRRTVNRPSPFFPLICLKRFLTLRNNFDATLSKFCTQRQLERPAELQYRPRPHSENPVAPRPSRRVRRGLVIPNAQPFPLPLAPSGRCLVHRPESEGEACERRIESRPRSGVRVPTSVFQYFECDPADLILGGRRHGFPFTFLNQVENGRFLVPISNGLTS